MSSQRLAVLQRHLLGAPPQGAQEEEEAQQAQAQARLIPNPTAAAQDSAR